MSVNLFTVKRIPNCCLDVFFFLSPQKQKYESLDELAADMNLIFDNAKHYNTDESSLYKVNPLLHYSLEKKKKKNHFIPM